MQVGGQAVQHAVAQVPAQALRVTLAGEAREGGEVGRAHHHQGVGAGVQRLHQGGEAERDIAAVLGTQRIAAAGIRAFAGQRLGELGLDLQHGLGGRADLGFRQAGGTQQGFHIATVLAEQAARLGLGAEIEGRIDQTERGRHRGQRPAATLAVFQAHELGQREQALAVEGRGHLRQVARTAELGQRRQGLAQGLGAAAVEAGLVEAGGPEVAQQALLRGGWRAYRGIEQGLLLLLGLVRQ